MKKKNPEMKALNDEAVKKGLKKIIDFDKSIMTDSGGYQVLEYGDLDILPPDMAKFETGILTDFAIPLDKPTGYGLPIKKAEAYVKHTLEVCKETYEIYHSCLSLHQFREENILIL